MAAFPKTVRDSYQRPRQSRLAQQDLDVSGFSPLAIPSSVLDEQLLFDVSIDMPQTPILIPSESGLFEVTAYAVCKVPSAAIISFGLYFNDGVFDQVALLLPDLPLASLGDYISSSQIIRAAEGSTVLYDAIFDVPGGEFDLWIRVKPV